MDLIKKINEFLFSKKAMPILVGGLSIGLILVVFSNVFIGDEIENDVEKTKVVENVIDNSADDVKEPYSEEENLEYILSCIKNVGEVDVQIVYKSTSEKVPLKINDNEGNETAVMESENSKNSPFIIKENNPEIEGIIVVVSGADDISLKTEIITAVSDVYDLPIHKVKVFDMK